MTDPQAGHVELLTPPLAGARPDDPEASTREFANAVALGLSDVPRWLPSRFLYDDRGSTLFEQICQTDEYYLTGIETEILRRHAEEIGEITGPVTLVELGSGSSVKTDQLLHAYQRFGDVHYMPVDVSGSILRYAIRAISQRHPAARVTGINGTYESAFPLLAKFSPSMLVFLGSTIGNLNQSESIVFWRRVARNLTPGDYLLLGVDLVKDEAILEAAYNDAAGVTAAFTINLFERINRELGANIDTSHVEHVAVYNPIWRRIEIFGRFLSSQTVTVAPLERDFVIPAGEQVMTEISRKFVREQLEAYAGCFGFRVRRVFTDRREWFAVLLLQKGESDGYDGNPDRD